MAATTKTWADNEAPSCNAVDLNGFKNENNSLIESSGQSLNAGDNQQTAKAVSQYATDGNSFTDSGSANAYILSGVGARVNPPAYTLGMEIRFTPQNANTGASTLNVGGLGAQSIKLDGIDMAPGYLVAGIEYRAIYNGTDFEVVPFQSWRDYSAVKSAPEIYTINGDKSVYQRGALIDNYGVDRTYISNASATQDQIRLTPAETILTGMEFAQEITQVNASDFHEQRVERPQRLLGLQTAYTQWIKCDSNQTLNIDEVWNVNGIETITSRGTINVTTQFQPLTSAILLRDDITGFGINGDDFVTIRVSGYGANKITVTGEQFEKTATGTATDFKVPGDNLGRCQQYTRAYTSKTSNTLMFGGFCDGSSLARIAVIFDEMRGTPTFEATGSFEINQTGSDAAVTSFNTISSSSTSIELGANTSGGLSSGTGCSLRGTSIGAEILLDTEL